MKTYHLLMFVSFVTMPANAQNLKNPLNELSAYFDAGTRFQTHYSDHVPERTYTGMCFYPSGKSAPATLSFVVRKNQSNGPVADEYKIMQLTWDEKIWRFGARGEASLNNSVYENWATHTEVKLNTAEDWNEFTTFPSGKLTKVRWHESTGWFIAALPSGGWCYYFEAWWK